MNRMEPPFPVDPDPIPESFLRTPSMRDEAIYLLRLFAVVIVVGMVLCQMLNFAIYGLGGRG